MFHGDSVELGRVMAGALIEARTLRSARTGSEHLLIALAASTHPVADVLAAAGAGPARIRETAPAAGLAGAGMAADTALLASIGVDLAVLLDSGRYPTDRPPAQEPWLPLGARRVRRWCAATNPPTGLDAQSAYEASLRLALGRRERAHRPEHLALTLVALDPGIAWLLKQADINRPELLLALAAAYPPPTRSRALRFERSFAGPGCARELTRRYERTTGRSTTSPAALESLINGTA